MSKSNIINRLNRKYSELLGQLHYVKPPPDNVKRDIEHLMATIKLFAPDWTGEGIKAKRLLKAELTKQGISYSQLTGKLADVGVMDSEPNVRNKISRGIFTAVFLLQCLTASGVERMEI